MYFRFRLVIKAHRIPWKYSTHKTITLLVNLFRLLALLPLSWLQALGVAIGWVTYWASPRYAQRLNDNLANSGICSQQTFPALRRAVIAETGKGVLELIAIWFASDRRLKRWCQGNTLNVIQDIRQTGRGVILITPHLGGFEMGTYYMSQVMPLTVMYRPPKRAWMEPVMVAGRGRWNTKPAPANRKGVRMLLRALQQAETVGIVPDQVPQWGEGKWADFFGRPAYTMTLISKLQKLTGAAIVVMRVERLAMGKGYALTFKEWPTENFDERALNLAMETQILQCPSQYLWGYHRYKVPEGVTPPPTLKEPI